MKTNGLPAGQILLALPLLLLAAPALAQNSDNSINLHHNYHPVDGQGFTVVSGASTLEEGSLHVQAMYGFAHQPLETRQPGGGRGFSLVDAQHVVDLAAAYGITDWLDVGLAMPLVLHHDGQRLKTSFPGTSGNSAGLSPQGGGGCALTSATGTDRPQAGLLLLLLAGVLTVYRRRI